MTQTIILWRRKATVSSDEACTTITSYSLPRYIPAPYEPQNSSGSGTALVYVPSLQSMCIRQLAAFPEQVFTLGNISLPYRPPHSQGDYDLLRELIPNFSHASQDERFLKYVDPRLWATLVQVYTGLPAVFRVYNLPLSDPHVPLLQQIPSNSRFALVTVLNLRGCDEVDDHTILQLRDLHGLAALDLSATALSSWGISRLSKTLSHVPSESADIGRRLSGPWELRILHLRDCMNIKDDVYESLQCFPLLSVIGAHVLAFYCE
ncbi:hypothetical protein BC835DRAFT_1267548 [Cytidiella melzeri]|nr:hypothetical protein BC835DRAFT_1267548 [Cytidiella melzeri]